MLYKSPLDQYQALVSSKQIGFDSSQQQAVDLLQQLHLILQPAKVPNKNNNKAMKGIYLWGKVGRGKTFLMDLFVKSLPENLCKRQHFHHFMRDVHSQLKEISGKPEPLKHIAQQFAKQYRVLCFDEFFVSDIGDAMLLGKLLQFMFEMNIVVVSTSNCAPNELYRNGLQRDRFLPAIAAIKEHTQALHLDGKRDHRHRELTYQQNYFELPHSTEQQVVLHQALLSRLGLAAYLPNKSDTINASDNTINILGREISCIAINTEQNKQAIAFEFSALCQGPRSHLDYVELAKKFTTILLVNVPPMSGKAYERIKARGTEDNGLNNDTSAGTTGKREVILAPMDDAVRRFIALVDECYDCQLNLLMTAYVPQSQLYNSGTLMFEFERTKSRLIEMASMEYLGNHILTTDKRPKGLTRKL